ncbi:hypothetical protein BEN49_03635 [Hymenobacter coccineus]|uniref:Transposase IS4-like domain-containing protein n=1 Tax=Hymenobacter coccineus TaxID=1908235 RepID=A0A1G1TMM6_9BACT|nr:hypothetical protein BEN49_03635 [Hymenobacter coccineus]
MVNTEGLPLAVQVQLVSVQDPVGAGSVLVEAKARAPNLQPVWVDDHYQGPLATHAAEAPGRPVAVVRKPLSQKGFVVLTRCWVVERTFAWLGRCRRLARRDCETNPRNSKAQIKIGMSNLMLRRFTKRTISKLYD